MSIWESVAFGSDREGGHLDLNPTPAIVYE